MLSERWGGVVGSWRQEGLLLMCTLPEALQQGVRVAPQLVMASYDMRSDVGRPVRWVVAVDAVDAMDAVLARDAINVTDAIDDKDAMHAMYAMDALSGIHEFGRS